MIRFSKQEEKWSAVALAGSSHHPRGSTRGAADRSVAVTDPSRLCIYRSVASSGGAAPCKRKKFPFCPDIFLKSRRSGGDGSDLWISQEVPRWRRGLIRFSSYGINEILSLQFTTLHLLLYFPTDPQLYLGIMILTAKNCRPYFHIFNPVMARKYSKRHLGAGGVWRRLTRAVLFPERRNISCFHWVRWNEPVNDGRKHLPPLPPTLCALSRDVSVDNEDAHKALCLNSCHIKQWTERPENSNDFFFFLSFGEAIGCEMNNCSSFNSNSVKCIVFDCKKKFLCLNFFQMSWDAIIMKAPSSCSIYLRWDQIWPLSLAFAALAWILTTFSFLRCKGNSLDMIAAYCRRTLLIVCRRKKSKFNIESAASLSNALVPAEKSKS